MEKGDLVLITGHVRIADEKFNQLPINYRYGRVVELKQQYNPNTGAKLPLQIVVRCRDNKGRNYHKSVSKKFIRILIVK